MSPFLEAAKVLMSSFPEAMSAGLLIAVACSFFGVFVVLQRVVFIGATLSEVAACGIAAAMFFHLNPLLGAVVFTLIAVTLLAIPFQEERIPRDAVMATLFIFAFALSILLVAKSGFGLEEVKSLLYGDLILTSLEDVWVLLAVLIPACFLLYFFHRPITYTFLDREEAKVLGIKVVFWELLFYYLLGTVISIASKLAGMLLVFCFLVIPTTTALLLSSRLKTVVWLAVIFSTLATLLGFYFSILWDLPVNPAIAVVSSLFLFSVLLLKLRK